MATVVFLRGMNLGKRRITNEDLIKVFADAGYSDVSAYQASGNIILGSESQSPSSDEVSEILASALDYEVPTFVRSAEQVEAIATESPIKGKAGSDGGKPQIVFLSGATRPTEAKLLEVFPDDHEIHMLGSEIHWLPPTGLNELGHINKAMDKTFGITTVRTLGTIERINKRIS